MAYKRRLRFDKRIKFRKSMSIMYILLFVVLASLGVGYSYIKSNLNINGTANVTAANWDVHFDNLLERESSTEEIGFSEITSDTTVEFEVILEEPNDFYEFTVDVVNEGTMDAMIDSFSISPTLTPAQAKYLEYSVTYFDNLELASNHELKSGEIETLRVRVSYKENSDKTNYPTEDQELTLELNVNYVQTSGEAIPVRNYAYRTNTNCVDIGDSVSSLGTTYNTPEALISATGKNIFLRHVIKNNVITRSDVGVFYNNKYYYLIGGGSTYDEITGEPNEDSIYYEINKNTASSTGLYCTIYSYATFCSGNTLLFDTRPIGSTSIQNGEWQCFVGSGLGNGSGCDGALI